MPKKREKREQNIKLNFPKLKITVKDVALMFSLLSYMTKTDIKLSLFNSLPEASIYNALYCIYSAVMYTYNAL